jgi:hypothetical protein
MPLLSTILTEKHDEILELMSKFNFGTDNVLLVCSTSPKSLVPISDDDELAHTLYFVTDYIEPEESDEVDENDIRTVFSDLNSLEINLSEKLDCDVGILIRKNIQDLYWTNVLHQCAKIDELPAIKKFFKVDSLDKIDIEPLNRTDPRYLRVKRITQAGEERALERASRTNLFKRKRTEDTHSSDSESEEELIEKKVKQLEKLPAPVLDEIWKRVQKSKENQKLIDAPQTTSGRPTRVK